MFNTPVYPNCAITIKPEVHKYLTYISILILFILICFSIYFTILEMKVYYVHVSVHFSNLLHDVETFPESIMVCLQMSL